MDTALHNPPTAEDILQAAARIRPFINRTPVLTSSTLNRMTGAAIFFKCENFQKAGAFKARGATNAVFSLQESQTLNGVATHSSGNHAQALAWAASLRNLPAYIVMPEKFIACKDSIGKKIMAGSSRYASLHWRQEKKHSKIVIAKNRCRRDPSLQ
jgi:threonine dehydratase